MFLITRCGFKSLLIAYNFEDKVLLRGKHVTPQLFFLKAIFFWEGIISIGVLFYFILFVCLIILWRTYEFLSDIWG